MYIAGTGQRMRPGFLGEYKPDTVLVMNAIYEDEIRALLGQADIIPDVVTV